MIFRGSASALCFLQCHNTTGQVTGRESGLQKSALFIPKKRKSRGNGTEEVLTRWKHLHHFLCWWYGNRRHQDPQTAKIHFVGDPA